MLVLESEWLVALWLPSEDSLPELLIRAFVISSPGWGFHFLDRTNMQRAPDRAATFKSFPFDKIGHRKIKLNARMTPNTGKTIADTMERSLSRHDSPGYDTTVAP